MGKGLSEALVEIPADFDDEYNSYHLSKCFYFPGYLTAVTAYLSHKNTPERNFDCEDALQASYLETLGLHNILWGKALPTRRNEGRNYTAITQLCSAEATDDVTASINGCLRHFTGYTNGDIPDGLSQLNHVVGELLDNVWSHGQSTGFSMAQKTAVPYSDGSDYYLEFSVVDKGLGFFEETKRTGKAREHNINSDSEALLWCIEKGNSTKHADDVDDWGQQLPPGHVGSSPYGAGIGSNYEVNHHQGLGLAHLVELVEKFQGTMIIASGSAILEIDESGKRSMNSLDTPWKGVAISCRFKLSLLLQEIEEETDEELLELMNQLRG